MTEATETKSVQEPVAAEKPYTFRRLGPEDIFLMFKIIGKIGVNEFSACFEKDGIAKLIANAFAKKTEEENDNSAAALTSVGVSVGLEIVNVICSKLPECRREIYQLLAQVSGQTEEDIKSMDGVLFVDMILDFVTKEEFADFIKVVSKRFK